MQKTNETGLRTNPLYPDIENIVSGALALPLAFFAAKRLRREASSWGAWAAVLGAAALLWKSTGRASLTRHQGIKVEKSVSIQRSPEELFAFWRNFENLPRIMTHLKIVQVAGKRSRWVADAPFGRTVEWLAEVINERPGEMIAWQSLPGSEVRSAGSVHFRRLPGDHGTEVRVHLLYEPPGGVIGDKVAWIFGKNAAREVEDDLLRFKQMMETGEAASVRGQPSGRSRMDIN